MKRIQNLFGKYPAPVAFLFYLLVAAVAWWQLAFLAYSVKWDMLDCFLPWRYFVGECWQNGTVPFWNPYQHFGYPIHADLRSAWYPEMFFVGLTGGYSNITMHFLIILYLAIAGLGMYRLVGFISNSQKVGLIIGMAYLLSGFFIGHGQDIGYIIGGAFLPWVLFYYLRLGKNGDWPDSLKTALFMLIMVMGSYPAFTIFLIYILLVLFIFQMFALFREKHKKHVWRFIGQNTLLFAIVVGGSLVLILTYPQIAPYTSRFTGIAYQDFIVYPFSPQSLISWFVPFVTINNNSIFQSDLSMINSYWGLLMMVFFVFAFRKKNPLAYLFLTIAVLSLFLSFGPYTPVHPFFYDFVPGVNMFRIPAIFILFTIVGLLICAGLGLKYLFENFDIEIDKLKKVLLIFMGVMLVGLVIGLIYFPYQDTVFYKGPNSIRGTFEQIGFFEQLAFHCLLQLMLLSVFYFWLKKGGKEKFLLKVGILVFIEMALAVQLNINSTAVSHFRPMELRAEMQALPTGYPTPDNRPVACHNELASKTMPLWHNVSIITKRPGIDGFNSFVLDSYDNLFDNYPKLAKAQLNNPLVFLSNQVFPLSKLENFDGPTLSGREIFVADSLLEQIDLTGLKNSKDDTAWVVSLLPNKVVIEYSGQHAQLLNLMQSDYVGWQAYLDGKKADHFTSNILFRSLRVPAGKHQVVYRYENDILQKAFYFSYAVFFLLLLVIIIFQYKKLRKQNRIAAIVFLAFVKLVLGIWVVLVIMDQIKISADQKSETKLMEQARQILLEEAGVTGIINVSNPEKWRSDNPEMIFVNILDRADLVSFYNLIDTCQADKLLYLWNNQKQLAETEELIRLKYPGVQTQKSTGRGVLTLFSKNGHDEREILFGQLEDYENGENNNVQDSGFTKSGLSSASGKYFAFSPNIEWGPGLVHKLETDFTRDGLKISASCDVALQEDCDVVFSIELFRGKKQFASEWIELQDFKLPINNWRKIILAYEPKFELRKGDEIKIHIWNRGKTNLRMDNLGMRVVE